MAMPIIYISKLLQCTEVKILTINTASSKYSVETQTHCIRESKQTSTDQLLGYLEDAVVQEGTTGDSRLLLALLVQPGPLDQPQWGCNLGAMGTAVGVTEVCPSAGVRAADWKTKHIAEATDKTSDGTKLQKRAYCRYYDEQ